MCECAKSKICVLDPKVMPNLSNIKGRSIVEQVSVAQMYLLQQVKYMMKGREG